MVEQEPEEIIEDEDAIDTALADLVEKIVSDPEDDDEWDEASDDLFEVIGNLVDNEEIEDVPDEEASDEQKQAWLETALPRIKTELESFFEDDFDEESGSEE